MDDLGRLKTCLSNQISMCYQGQATVVFPPDAENVLKDYFNRGFRYFVFEIKEYDWKDFTDSDAILYRFQSTSLYYPLVISKIGGVGRTLVDIVALTPNTLAFPQDGLTLRTPENRQGQVTLNDKGTVLFDKGEIEEIDEDLADFTKEWPEIRARNFLISGQINSFAKDFIMIRDVDDSHAPAESPEFPPESLDTPNTDRPI